MPATPFPRPVRGCRCALAFVPVLGLLGLLGACAGEGQDSAAADTTAADSTATAAADTGAAAPQEKAIKVDVGLVLRGDLVESVFADGEIRTPRMLDVKAKIGGQLVEVLIRDGDEVRQGQVLARIDPREHRLDLEKSRYDHLRALSQIAAEQDTYQVDLDALREFETSRRELDDLRDGGRLSESEYQARLLELEMTALERGAFRQEVFQQRTGLADARVAEERARLNLEYTEIRAPFAGTVQGRQITAGANITAGQTICSLYDNRHLEAVVNVLEADLANLEPGRAARVAVPAVRDTLHAQVDVIAAALDPASRTCEVLIRFENTSGRFRPGMFCRAEIAGFVHRDRLKVPKAAVLVRDDRPLVFKRTGDRAQWLYVTTGLENDSWVEILQVHSGGSLAPGEEVVVSDPLTLSHEALIDVRKQVPPTDRWDFMASREGSGQ